ncbi:hypothetical protein SLS60_011923 [Paraconiothyrium brasiliense]|uniref:Uncharacterized protein n=1 Tax=Paraconiothyrium brasiliense TaxID=300254 RepID=A0ABR3QH93_9PLEO
MDPAQIIASVNKENLELQKANDRLVDEIEELRKLRDDGLYRFNTAFQAQTYDLLAAMSFIDNLRDENCFLQSYLAHTESQSEQALWASHQTAKFFERALVEDITKLHQEAENLSPEACALHQAVLKKIEAGRGSEKQTRQKIAEIESNIILKEIQHNDLKYELNKNKGYLKEVKESTTAMIQARDDLNSKLARANDALRAKAGKRSHADRKEQTRLKEELANAEASLRDHKYRLKELEGAIASEEKLQVEVQLALAEAESARLAIDYYKSSDNRNSKTITSLKNEVEALKLAKKNSDSSQKIKDQEAEIESLHTLVERLREELKTMERLFNDSMKKTTEQARIAEEALREVKMHKGQALAMAQSLPDGLSKRKWKLALQILDGCWHSLKDLDSQRKAERAVAWIKGFLSEQHESMVNYMEEVRNNGEKIREMIENMLKQIPKKVTPDTTTKLMEYVRALREDVEKRSIGETERPVTLPS